MSHSAAYRDVADAAWRWVLDEVRWDDGPWIPETVEVDSEPGPPEIPELRDGMHSGIGGLAHALAELRAERAWTDEEQRLADAIRGRIRAGIPTTTSYDFFDGLVSDIGVLGALGGPDAVEGMEMAVGRLESLAADDGWPQTAYLSAAVLPDSRLNDATLGTAGVLLGALWARRLGAGNARRLADRAADLLLAEEEATGLTWLFVPRRFRREPGTEMPNFSHGVAGIAAALAVAGAELDRSDLVEAAVRGAEMLVRLADTAEGGLRVPRYLPHGIIDEDLFSHGWCHGGSGTSLLFVALDRAGVESVAGEPPRAWHRRCVDAVRTSGVPARLRPGFWDNDGRCCGTAGVGEVFLDSWQREGDDDDLDFGLSLADALVEHAVITGPHAYWRFTEHRNAAPLLPPGVGWMQGAAGIATCLYRADRVRAHGSSAATIPRMDSWWALPERAG